MGLLSNLKRKKQQEEQGMATEANTFSPSELIKQAVSGAVPQQYQQPYQPQPLFSSLQPQVQMPVQQQVQQVQPVQQVQVKQPEVETITDEQLIEIIANMGRRLDRIESFLFRNIQ